MRKVNMEFIINKFENYVQDLDFFWKNDDLTCYINFWETSPMEEDEEEVKELFKDEKDAPEIISLDTTLVKEQYYCKPLEETIMEVDEKYKNFFDDSLVRWKAYTSLHTSLKVGLSEKYLEGCDNTESEIYFVDVDETVKLSEILESEISVAVFGAEIIDDLYQHKSAKILKKTLINRLEKCGVVPSEDNY